MTGLVKYPPAVDDSDWNSLIDFLGGPTSAAQITTLKILLEGAGGALLSSWQAAGDLTKIDAAKIYGVIPVGNLSPLTGDLDFNGHKAKNILIDVLGADPNSPAAGQAWYRSDLEKLSLRRASVVDRVVLESLAQTLTNKTLTTPTIGDFSNAQHGHAAAASGGSLDAAAIGSGNLAAARMQTNILAAIIAAGGVVDADVAAAAAIAWSKVSKTGSSLADLVTRSAGDLASGDLAAARMATNILAAFGSVAANYVLAGPTTGAATPPTFRSAVAADIPNLDTAKITTGQFPLDRMPRAASGFLAGAGAGSNPAYRAILTADLPIIPAARLQRTTNQSIATITITPISFGTVLFDTDTMYAAGNPTRLTVKTAGVYYINAWISYAQNTTGTKRTVFIRLNGTTNIGEHATVALPANEIPDQNASAIWKASVNDYFECCAYHDASAAVNILGGRANHYGPALSAVFLSP